MITNVHYRPLELPRGHRLLLILAMALVFIAVLLWPKRAPRPETTPPAEKSTPTVVKPASP